MSGFNLQFPQFQQLDIATPLLQAEQIKSARAQQESNQLQQKIQNQSLLQSQQKFLLEQQSSQLAGLALQGDKNAFGALSKINPTVAINIQEHLGQQAKQEQELAKNQRAINAQNLGGLYRLAESVHQNQANWEIVRQSSMKLFGHDPGEYSPERLNQIKTMAAQGYQANYTPEPSNEFSKRAIEEGLIPGSMSAKKRAETLESLSDQKKLKRAAASATKITNINDSGKSLPTNANLTEAQRKLLRYDEAQSRLDKISEYDSKDFLSLKGRGLNFYNKMADFVNAAGPAGEKHLRDWTRFKTNVETEFQARVYDISKATTSTQQMLALKDAYLNLEQSPTEFDESKKDYQEEVKRQKRLYRRFIAEGIDVTTDDGGKLFDQQFVGKRSQANSRQDIKNFLQDLVDQGITETKEQRRLLKEEGYIQ